MKDKVESLIEILFDPYADISDQDDAAGYLGEYDDDRALNALVKAGQNSNTDDWITNIWGINSADMDKSQFIR